MNSTQPEHVPPQALEFGPVNVDSSRMGPELTALAAVMVMLIAFKWAWKKIK